MYRLLVQVKNLRSPILLLTKENFILRGFSSSAPSKRSSLGGVSQGQIDQPYRHNVNLSESSTRKFSNQIRLTYFVFCTHTHTCSTISVVQCQCILLFSITPSWDDCYQVHIVSMFWLVKHVISHVPLSLFVCSHNGIYWPLIIDERQHLPIETSSNMPKGW